MPDTSGRLAAIPAARPAGTDPVQPVVVAVAGGAALVGIVVFAVIAALGAVVVGLVVGAVAAVAVGLATWAGIVRPRLAGAEERVLDLVGPHREVDPAASEHLVARFLNLVEGLAPAAGVARPRCFVVDDPAPNALAAGRDDRHGCVVVTTGLIDSLSRMELEGVVAQSLVRIRDGVVAAPTVALALGRGGRVADLVARAGGSLPSDLAAFSLTRYPPGLAAALRRLVPVAGAVPGRASTLLGPLWLVPPGSADVLQQRIAALEEV
jgi:heat shock protein HtpX